MFCKYKQTFVVTLLIVVSIILYACSSSNEKENKSAKTEDSTAKPTVAQQGSSQTKPDTENGVSVPKYEIIKEESWENDSKAINIIVETKTISYDDLTLICRDVFKNYYDIEKYDVLHLTISNSEGTKLIEAEQEVVEGLSSDMNSFFVEIMSDIVVDN